MKYSTEKLIANQSAGNRNKYLFFWGHQPAKDGSITKTCFSQWWLSAFTVEGVTYATAEHWMMAKKALLFEDKETLHKILSAKSPAEAKKLGRKVKNYQDEVWLANRYAIVKEGNLHKFSQNQALKDFLLNTADRVIVEASPVDSIWGIGMATDHKDIENPEKWKGLNLLGFALMEVRDELRTQ
ncbi:NADAR family protein [Emticicia agri]|uniref:NADAR family protein n=1 Tax=Emticicia agri TaxID=2492393 RepID=A0A4Q5LXZ8_9BACT|nr:NADAR family protein [Emticicia agri]RYU94642.1 NADAR family protein [Emticicia agri]